MSGIKALLRHNVTFSLATATAAKGTTGGGEFLGLSGCNNKKRGCTVRFFIDIFALVLSES